MYYLGLGRISSIAGSSAGYPVSGKKKPDYPAGYSVSDKKKPDYPAYETRHAGQSGPISGIGLDKNQIRPNPIIN